MLKRSYLQSRKATFVMCALLLFLFYTLFGSQPNNLIVHPQTYLFQNYKMNLNVLHENVKFYNKRRSGELLEKSTKSYTSLILFWTEYFGKNSLEGIDFNKSKKLENCRNFNCEFISDRSQIHKAHAIVFHSADINKDDMPTFRSENQRWIFFTQESPLNTNSYLRDFNHIFNWTMTYRKDSDIYFPYGEIQRFQDFSEIIPTNFQKSKIGALKSKTKLIAWMVSNCKSKSHREEIAEELEKYIPVEIYGGCGAFKCKRDSGNCFAKIGSKYKFYMAFENSMCVDYVTEKFFNPLSHFIVPVVYGLANYSSFAPPNSFIDVRDFKTVKELADYLVYLDKNPEEYLKYFEWKKEYKMVSENEGWCRLCNQVQRTKTLPSKIYYNLFDWWFNKPAPQLSKNENKSSIFHSIPHYKELFLNTSTKNFSCWTVFEESLPAF